MAEGPAKDSWAGVWTKRLNNSPIIAAFIIPLFLAGAASFRYSIEKLERSASKIVRKQEVLTLAPPAAFRPESKSSNEVASLNQSIAWGEAERADGK